MNPYTGNMGEFSEIMRQLAGTKAQPIPLTQDQYTELLPLGASQRKGYMRNRPCICGSGEKFKRCCWDNFQ